MTDEVVKLNLRYGGKKINMEFSGQDAQELLRVVSEAIYRQTDGADVREQVTHFRANTKPLNKPFFFGFFKNAKKTGKLMS